MDTVPHSALENNSDDYVVYALIDQRDFSIFYIGITNNVYARFIQHIRCDGINVAKDALIAELKSENVMLIMKTLEHVQGFPLAREREAFWIQHYLFLGVPLLNQSVPTIHIASKPRTKQHIQRSIRPGVKYGRRYGNNGVKEIILHRLKHGAYPDGTSDDMRLYYDKHYIRKSGRGYGKARQWRREQLAKEHTPS